MPKYSYENSEQRGLKVNSLEEDQVANLSVFRSVVGNGAKLEAKGGELLFQSKDKSKAGKVSKSGTLEWFGDFHIHGDVQKEGKRVEVWQNVITTGDNLIELNDNLEEAKMPYSGIEVNRGKDPNAFLLFTEDTERWSAVKKDGKKKTIALHGDSLKNFDQNLTTDDVEEGNKNKYSAPIKASHNFWVSGEVMPTAQEKREILPTFISVGKKEKKFVTKVRGRLSSGKAKIGLLLNSQKKGSPISIGQMAEEEMELPVKDGDQVGIDILDCSSARNLSVSIEITRHIK